MKTSVEAFVDRKQIQIRKLTRRQVRQNKILDERKLLYKLETTATTMLTTTATATAMTTTTASKVITTT